jgi:hypothetical protein
VVNEAASSRTWGGWKSEETSLGDHTMLDDVSVVNDAVRPTRGWGQKGQPQYLSRVPWLQAIHTARYSTAQYSTVDRKTMNGW